MLGTPIWPDLWIQGLRLKNLSAIPDWPLKVNPEQVCMPCDYDLGQAGQGFLASLTNFWPHQPQPVQANCRPIFSVFPCQALSVFTPASRGLSGLCRPFMFFAVSSQFWPQPTVARPGQAGPVAAASPGFYPVANMAKARPQARLTRAFRPGWPRSGRVPDAKEAITPFAVHIKRKLHSFAGNGNQQREDTFISAKKRTFAHKSDSITISAF